jgi:bifunctional non-homologous end joining protein LigD
MRRHHQSKRGKRKAKRKSPARKHGKKLAATLKQARRAPLARFVKPCLATLVARAPDDSSWEHETKLDGYRIQARLDHGNVKLMTRKGLDWTRKFPSVAKAVGKLRTKTALIDGELVVFDSKGISKFSLLQQDLTSGRQSRMVLCAFDLMHLNGLDLQPLSLSARKAALAKLLRRGRDRHLRLSRSLRGHGPALLKRACREGQEGIISKRIDARYHSGHGRDWLKAKCSDRQELVVAGFAPSSADAHSVGALVLAFYRNGKLCYAGRTGTGFTCNTARMLYRRLKARARKTSPFKPVPKDESGRRKPVWVEPSTVVEVDFHGWTQGNRVRQASFQGVRRDKSAKDVVREVKY